MYLLASLRITFAENEKRGNTDKFNVSSSKMYCRRPESNRYRIATTGF